MKLSVQLLFLLVLFVAIAAHVAAQIDEYNVEADPFVNVEEENVQQPRTISEPAAGDHVILKASAHGDTRTVVDILRHDIELVHLRNDVGWSALTFAAANGHTELVTALIEHGADVNNQENDLWTPLMFAAYHGDDGIVFNLLDHQANALLKNDRGFTAHELARLREHDYAAHILGTQSVFQAIAAHDMQALLHHVAQGVSPNVQNTAGWTPLISAVDAGDADAVVTLLNLGADVNLSERDNWSPLMFAAFRGAEDLVLLLLRHGADPNILAHNRETARSAEEMARERGFNDIAALIASHTAELNGQHQHQQEQHFEQETSQVHHQEEVQREVPHHEERQEHHMNHHEQQQARHESVHSQHDDNKDASAGNNNNNKKAQEGKKKKGGTGFFNW